MLYFIDTATAQQFKFRCWQCHLKNLDLGSQTQFPSNPRSNCFLREIFDINGHLVVDLVFTVQ